MPTFRVPTAPVGHDRIIIVTSRSYSETPNTLRLLWSSDQPLTTHNTHKRQIYNPPEGFEDVIPASKRPVATP